jgi:asparagine synthetase B (glutamine-hydrolysing)
MCGILLIDGTVAPERQQAALEILQRRGPDFTVTHQQGQYWLAQSVLHITGTTEFYHSARDDAFVFNGEIYNWRSFGPASTDTEVAWRAAREDPRQFQHFTGPWAWIRATSDHVWYATDPQGEHFLYRYQQPGLTIVASEVAVILALIDCEPQHIDYANKGWTLLEHTPWQHIERLTPGQLYHNHQAVSEIDSIWRWICPTNITEREAREHWQWLWPRVMREMQPQCAAAISYSGGVDSSIILSQMPDASLVATNMLGKDPIVDRVRDFLTAQQLERLTVVDCDPEGFARSYRELIEHSRMPAQSWSFVGKWLVAQHASAPVIFTGLAADELFGGYTAYRDLEFTADGSASPYSQHDSAGLWPRCMAAYHDDPKPATLLMDYWYQIVGCDSPGQHRLSGAWGRESRNPFMHRDVMQFALNLPWSLRQNKPLLREEFLQHWPPELLFAKQGFTGHANDGLPWMSVTVVDQGDRHQTWKQIAKTTFYNYTGSSH